MLLSPEALQGPQALRVWPTRAPRALKRSVCDAMSGSIPYNLRPRSGAKQTADLEHQRMEEERLKAQSKEQEKRARRRSPGAEEACSDEHDVMAFFSGKAFADSCVELGPAPFHLILAFLGPAELAACCAVSRGWRDQAEEERLWAKHVAELWRTKVLTEGQDLREITRARHGWWLEP